MGLFDRLRKRSSNTTSSNEPSSHHNNGGEDGNGRGGGAASSSSPSRKQVTWAAAGLERSVTLKSESSRHYQQQTAGSRYGDKTYSDGQVAVVASSSAGEAAPPMSTFDSDSDEDGAGNHSGYYRYRRSGKHTNSTIDSRRSVMTSSYVIDGMDDDVASRNSTRSIASNGCSGARVLDKLDSLEDRKESAIQRGDLKRAASADKQQAIVVLGETVLVNRETLRALRRTEKDMNDAETAGHHTLLELQRQLEVMYRVDAALDANDTLFERASKDIRAMFRQMSRDKCMVCCCCTVCVVLLLIVIILIRKVALGFSLGTALGFGSDSPAPPPAPSLSPSGSTTTTTATTT